jgi:subtilisin-like proprotein convertase family protein
MKVKNLFLLSFFIISNTLLFAQKSIWSKTDESRIVLTPQMERKIQPEKYTLWQADFQAIKSTLDKAPLEFTNAAQQPLVFELPLPNVGLVKFKTIESPVYAPGLYAKYPVFKTFAAVGGERGEYKARFDYTLNGFSAIVSTPDGEVYIDPFATGQTTYYISYFTYDNKDKNQTKGLTCGAEHEDFSPNINSANPFQSTGAARSGDLVTVRKYRLAITATGEFSAKHGGTKASALSYVVQLVNRCNKKFSDELAIRFELIANNDTLIFTDAAKDPFLKGNLGKEILSVSTSVIKARVGDANYDVGHTVAGPCSDVGGVANAGVICNNASKGSGMSGDAGGTADQFAVTIMCHEMGHQFSASHTMSACGNGDDQSQVASSSAIEPGSGTTIMSYDGSCGTDNITGQYWHKITDVYSVGSLEQMMEHSRTGSGNSCPEKTLISNHIPNVDIPLPNGLNIPIGTPFELTAVGSDMDNDPISYSWEQADDGMYVPLGSKKTLFANTFRVFEPVTTPTRIFPKLADILANKTTKAELYPDTTRNYTFRCTVRDNNITGGGTVWDEIKFKSTHTAGPFVIKYPNTAFDTLSSSEYSVLKWDVANTDKALVNAQNVDILLSTDGGFNFSTFLLKNTPNDGSEGVIIPSGIATASARIKIKPTDNIFFTISQKNFTVNPSTKKGYTFAASSSKYVICLPDVTIINVQTSAFGGFDKKVKLSIAGSLPNGATAKFAKDSLAVNESTSLSLDMTKVTTQGIYTIKIRAIAGTDTLYREITFKTIYANFDDLALATPNDGATAQSTLPSFKWNASKVADSYDFQVANNPSFADNTILYSKENLKVLDINAPVTLQENTVYFWRVRAKNTCRSGAYNTPFAFSTLVQSCKEITKDDKINISSGAKNSYESLTSVAETGKVNDINIIGIKGNHDDFGDLEMILESPLGKVATLFSKKCSSISANYNLSFDDESASGFNCSFITAAPTFKPLTPLSVFDGDEIQGTWKLKINDTKVGNGGLLTNWRLKFCFATSITAPTIIKNDTLHVKKGKGRYIDFSTLAAKDDKSSGVKLVYTLVKEPENGFLDKWNAAQMKVGETFTQDDLDKGQILRYVNSATAASDTDYFLFVISDGDGGFLGTLRYNIIRDENAPTGVNLSPDIEKAVRVFPNPSNQSFGVQLNNNELGKVELALFNVQGQKISTQFFLNENIDTQFEVQSLPNGIYYLKINTEKGAASKKIVVQH